MHVRLPGPGQAPDETPRGRPGRSSTIPALPGSLATIHLLQASAGNRATSQMLSSRPAGGRPVLQRDALAAAADTPSPVARPAGDGPDPETITGDGETGPKPSDWARGGGGDGPAPVIPADEGDAARSGADLAAGEAQPGADAVAIATGDGGAVALAGGSGPQVGPGQTGGSSSVGGPAQAGQATAAGSSGGPTQGGGTSTWTQRPEGVAITRALSASAIGRDALQTATRYAVEVVFQAKGRPAAYDAGDNHCYLDPATPTPELATYFVHEMYHASQTQQGLSPLPDKAPDREAWVDTMVSEEVKATWLSFEARAESGISAPLGSGPLADAWTRYLRVTRYWRDTHLASNPGDAAGADAIAISKGRALVRYLIVGDPGGGTLPGLGPDQFSSYAMFYRRQWNIAHNGRP